MVLAAVLAACTGLGWVLYRRKRDLYCLEYREVHSYDQETLTADQ